ncbi:ketol-acid reductoisomerase [soil metagenome]
MAKIYYDTDIELDTLRKYTFAVIGYGNQGRAQALNLRDSGLTVKVGARKNGEAFSRATADGFTPIDIESATAECEVLVLLLPDEHVPNVYNEQIKPHLNADKVFVFAHGFSVHHKTISLPKNSDLLLVAPTGPGRQLRTLYEAGKGLPALVAVEQDASGLAWQRCLAYARAIGCTRAGVVKTTFAEETVTDLFCEQAVLCGGVPALIKASFNTLVQAGYQPELAYISCLKEVKLIADLLFDQGIDGMRRSISTTAQYGSAITGPEIVDSRTVSSLESALKRIETGTFAKQFLQEAAVGAPTIRDLLQSESNSRLARIGRELKDSLRF